MIPAQKGSIFVARRTKRHETKEHDGTSLLINMEWIELCSIVDTATIHNQWSILAVDASGKMFSTTPANVVYAHKFNQSANSMIADFEAMRGPKTYIDAFRQYMAQRAANQVKGGEA